MNTSKTPPGDAPDEHDLAALLRSAGPRDRATADIEAQVRAAVAAEWRATVASRQRKHRTVTWLAVASVATVAAAAWLAQPLLQRNAGPVATVALVSGSVQVRHADGNDWETLERDEFDPAGRHAADLGGGPPRPALARTGCKSGWITRLNWSLRMPAQPGSIPARSTSIPARPRPRPTKSFVLQTAVGAVRHLGTQYEVRTIGSLVQVNVREGSVAIERAHDRLIGNAGERLSLGAGGDVVRTNLSPYATQWAWVQAITPAFAIEDRPLDEFLTWAAHETGRKLVFTSRAAAEAAESIRLQGFRDRVDARPGNRRRRGDHPVNAGRVGRKPDPRDSNQPVICH